MQSIVGGSRLVAETAWERYGGDESADRCCYHRRICGHCCYHAICSCSGAAVGERDCADEFADAAVTMLFELLSCWGAAAGERDCADESADAAVTMLFELLGWSCWGAMRRQICGQSCCHAICSCWVQVLGSDTAETNLRRVLLPCYLSCWAVGVQLLGSETAQMNLRTVLWPCYLQLLGRSCWAVRYAAADAAVCGCCCAIRCCGRCS